MRRLLIVHPHTTYDTAHLTQGPIQSIASDYEERDTLIILAPEESDALTYLGKPDFRGQFGQHRLGNVPLRMRGALTDGVTHLTIIGHTGCYCHHTAFEDVLEQVARVGSHSYHIHLPASAISRPVCDDGTSMKTAIDERVAGRAFAPPPGYPEYRVTPGHPRRAHDTHWQFLDYLRVAKFRAQEGRFTLTVCIDDGTMHPIGEGTTQLTISIAST
jgi:hypothetical protein